MSEAQTVRVRLLYIEENEGDWPPEQAADFMAWWRDKLEQIPQEHRSRAGIEISSDSDYDGASHACLEIFYSRPETYYECEERLRSEGTMAMEREKRDRAQYETLRKRFGGIE